jgi:S-(hydroxymethyl)glutathione dehydrogenase/alcohol dehydrogenase
MRHLMKITAAVLVELGRPLELMDLDVPALKPGQVLVEVAYSGVCHTQLSEVRGLRGPDSYLPHCLGHEGSGVVREVSPGVTRVKSDDRVILSWIKGEGADVPGTVYRGAGKDVNAGAVTSFSTYSVVSENRLTPIPSSMSMRLAALVGCAVPTGAGVVFNTARPGPGQSLAVFGVGGVGSCAIAAAALAGCHPVVAVDVRPEKLALARRLGATETVLAGADPVSAILKLCPGGVDFAIEATGVPQVMGQALACVRPRGGAAVVVGNARFGTKLEIAPREFNQGKRLLGTWGGDSVPGRDYLRYCRLLTSGKLDLDPILSPGYPLTAINQALDDLARGEVARPMIDLAAADIPYRTGGAAC